ncbi:MAG: endolytic transglycosylase MltG [Candidatus Zixiibacteriota bacterium]|nr:MAG: endolytic transglycosylase MltG [candidate division Zixibacteria bacterium]
MLRKTIIVLLVVVVVATAYFGISYIREVDIGERTISVVVASGDSFHAVAGKLLDSGVVSSRPMLFYPARWRGIDRKLVPGRYDFTGKNSCRTVLDKLERGDFVTVRVTIIEGAPIWKVAAIIAERMEVDSADIVALNTDSVFLSTHSIPCLEGYIFPETYFFPWGTGVRDIVDGMITMYNAKTTGVWPEQIVGGLSREEVVVLASIVEAEARFNEEKPRIASVYHNRLRRNMKLDADPTVIYGLGGLDRPLYKRDLRKKSDFNTYLKKGLPPTPINSPGLAAILAVLHPEETDYLFFVADGTGRHRFSRTNAEHNRARREIERELEKGES